MGVREIASAEGVNVRWIRYNYRKRHPREYLLECMASLMQVCISNKAMHVDLPCWKPNWAGDDRAKRSK